MAKCSLIGFIKDSKLMLFFAKYYNQSDCYFKSVDSNSAHNSPKSNNLERLLRFFKRTLMF